MPRELQNTNYNGAVVSNEMAAQLKRTPLGEELLRFENAGDKTVMQARLPEMGRYVATGNNDPSLAGQEYNIRVNMNYLVQGMVRFSMDDDGNIDPNRVSLLDNMCEDLNNPAQRPEEREKRLNDFMTALAIPEGQKREFKVFLAANDVPPTRKPSKLLGFGSSPVNMMLQELDGGMLQYQKAVSGALGEDAKKYAKQYQTQYENIRRSYREIADMDPKREKRILYPADCVSFAAITDDFIKQNNAFREAHDLGTYQVNKEELNFKDQPEEPGKKKLFPGHHYLSANVTVDEQGENGMLAQQDYTITLETTAPPGGDILFRPTPERTGIGIFNSRQEAVNYHTNANQKALPKFDTFMKVKNDKVYTVQKGNVTYTDTVSLPPERTYSRYYQLHTGKNAVGLSDKKLVDYTAKAAASLRLLNAGLDGFSLDLTRQLASNFRQRPAFKAIIRGEGMDKVRRVMTGGKSADLVNLLLGDKKRYAVSDEAKQKLQLLGSKMNESAKDKEWNELRKVLTDNGMKDSEAVFDAVEKFTKGKKSVKNDPERKAKVDLALDALAIVAENGDHVAKARAQILVDRFNEVRGAQRGQNNFVDLEQRGKVELPEKQHEAAHDEQLIRN